MRFRGDYPDDWKELSHAIREAAGWRCVRCRHPHERPGSPVPCDGQCDPAYHAGGLNDGKQRILTVHHLDGDKDNCRWWNCAALCQVCHLVIQGRVVMDRGYLFPHSEWFKPYAAGFYAYTVLGEDLTREDVEARMEELLAAGQPWLVEAAAYAVR